jgi:hypothetical protein
MSEIAPKKVRGALVAGYQLYVLCQDIRFLYLKCLVIFPGDIVPVVLNLSLSSTY